MQDRQELLRTHINWCSQKKLEIDDYTVLRNATKKINLCIKSSMLGTFKRGISNAVVESYHVQRSTWCENCEKRIK